MARLRGRAPIGQRVIDPIPHGHWQTTPLIAARGTDGIRCSTTGDGAVNGDVFEAFVEQVITPQLKSGEVGVMDNLASPKRPRTRTLIESTGAGGIFLPPYSPDLRPIENVFARIKPLPGCLACRSRDVLWPAIQSVLDQLTPTEAANCFRHCGYPLQMN